MADMRVATQLANQKRSDLRELKRHIRAGRVSMESVFTDRPECACHLPLIDVMGLARVSRGAKGHAWRERVGSLAVRDGVNLMVPLGRSSVRSREWASRACPTVSAVVAGSRRARELERAAA